MTAPWGLLGRDMKRGGQRQRRAGADGILGSPGRQLNKETST